MVDMDAVRERAQAYFEGVSPAHDWFHVQRVERLAMHLAAEEGADRRVVRLAVLLHDIGRAKEDAGEIDDHAAWGAAEAADILAGHGVDRETREAVVHCIRAHRYSTEPAPETLEAKVLSDADNLDGMGATGVLRTAAYSGEHGRPLADPDLPVSADDAAAGSTAVNHLQTKILSLRDRMYTETARELAAERHAFVERFVDRFLAEQRGEA